MREIITYFVIVCLVIASGAPSDEKSVIYTKNFNYKNKDVIYALERFSKDEMVYAVCEGSGAVKKCKVYSEYSYLDQTSVQSCDLDLEYSTKFKVKLFNAGNFKVVFSVLQSQNSAKLINVNLKGCHVSESILDFKMDLNLSSFRIIVVPREENYDVVYKNTDLCPDSLCIVTFDYEGKIVKPASAFFVKHMDSFLEVKAANKGYLVREHNNDKGYDVYLTRDGVNKPKRLLTCTICHVANWFAQENELGVCVHDNWEENKKMLCRRFDADGKPNKAADVEIDTTRRGLKYFEALNHDKGLLTLAVVSPNKSSSRSVFVQRFDEQGKPGKFVDVGRVCDELFLLPKLYRRSDGQYCFSSICLAPIDGPERGENFSRISRCFLENELL